MKKTTYINIIIIALILSLITTGCASSNKVPGEEPYLISIITTYNEEGNTIIDTFEIYSDMQVFCSSKSVVVYDSPLEDERLFFTNLKYSIKAVNIK